VLEATHLLALVQLGVAGNEVRAAIAKVQPHVDELEPDARDQDGRNRHQGDQRARGQHPAADHRPFIFAKEPFDAP